MKPVVLQKLHDDQRRVAALIETSKRVVLRCGRRWGKTALLERMAILRAAQGGLVGWFSPTYKLNIPTYRHIHASLRPILESASKIDAVIRTRSQGAVEFWTLQDEDAGRSRYYDLVIIDEASLVTDKLRDIFERSIAPTLLDREGTAVMAGTPKGVDPDNYFYLTCTEPELHWKPFHAPTSHNPHLNPAAVARLKDEYPPLVYQQEYLAEFVDWVGEAFFSRDALLEDGAPAPIDPRCDIIYAVIDTALKDRSEHDATAVVYFAHNRPLPDGTFRQRPLTILDWDLVQIKSDLLSAWLPTVYQRLDELAKTCGARLGWSGPYIEDRASGITLLQHCARLGMAAEPLPSALTQLGKEGRALNVSGYVSRGMVKLSEHAFNKVTEYRGKSRNHLLSQVVGFRIGEKELHEMDLLDCFTYGIAVGLGNSEGF